LNEEEEEKRRKKKKIAVCGELPLDESRDQSQEKLCIAGILAICG